MAKPEKYPDWATDHAVGTTPADPDAGTPGDPVIEPSAEKKGDGWGFKEKPPYNFFNWLFKFLGLWVRWFETHGATHVHDGGSTDLSAVKVDLFDHVDVGENGELSKTTDTVDDHIITHGHTAAGNATFETDNVTVSRQVQFGELGGAFRVTTDTASTHLVQQVAPTGTDRIFQTERLNALDRLQAAEIRAFEIGSPSSVVKLRNSAGSADASVIAATIPKSIIHMVGDTVQSVLGVHDEADINVGKSSAGSFTFEFVGIADASFRAVKVSGGITGGDPVNASANYLNINTNMTVQVQTRKDDGTYFDGEYFLSVYWES